MTLRMYADRKDWDLQGVQVDLRHERIHARDCEDCETEKGMLDQIHTDLQVTGNLDDEQRTRLLEIAENIPVAIMCAEKSFHECHRKLTSDFLVASRAVVQHILADGKLESHKLSETAKVQDGELTYPESHPLFD